MMPSCCICIPIYKPYPSTSERLSLQQAIRWLSYYDFQLVYPQGMDTSAYQELIGEQAPLQFQAFAPRYFQGIKGYNALMLSRDFYARFSAYDYLLIYQLDALVFQDSLSEWLQAGYDYVGAPWFEGYGQQSTKLIGVGNGGLSLRKVAAFRTLLESKRPNSRFYQKVRQKHIFFPLLPHKALKAYRRNTPFYAEQHTDYHEDNFIAYCQHTHQLHIPDALTASRFSMEAHPAWLFSQNGGVKPFGCHAWEKFDPIFYHSQGWIPELGHSKD